MYCAHQRSARRLVEQVRALAHHHADIGDGALVDEVGVVPRHPVEVLARRLQPAAVLAHAVLAADDVVIRHHAAGQRLVEPHLLFLRRLVHVAPARRAGGPGGRHVGGHLALLHGVADAALQRAAPDGRIVAAAALVVALEPLAEFAELHQVGGGANAAAQVGEVEVRRLLLLGDGIVELPQIDGALVELVPVGDGARRRQVPALFAVADRQRAERRPGVGEQAVHVVERVDLLHDGRHVVGHVGGEHAGAEQPRILGVMHGVALRVALEPLGVRLHGVLPVEVGAHARDHVHAALLGGGAAVAEEIAVAEEFALPVERHLGLIERQDAGDAHHARHRSSGWPSSRPTARRRARPGSCSVMLVWPRRRILRCQGTAGSAADSRSVAIRAAGATMKSRRFMFMMVPRALVAPP